MRNQWPSHHALTDVPCRRGAYEYKNKLRTWTDVERCTHLSNAVFNHECSFNRWKLAMVPSSCTPLIHVLPLLSSHEILNTTSRYSTLRLYSKEMGVSILDALRIDEADTVGSFWRTVTAACLCMCFIYFEWSIRWLLALCSFSISTKISVSLCITRSIHGQ